MPACRVAACDRRLGGYSFTTCSKPPQNMREPSKGISMFAISGSWLIFSWPRRASPYPDIRSS